MTQLPILFGFRQIVQGDGFIAGVAFKGAALVSDEDGEWWATGVYPCGISAGGSSIEHAIAELKGDIGLALEDAAFSAKGDFSAFRNEVERLYNQKGASTMADFDAARQEVRSGRAGYDSLPKVENPEFSILVETLDSANVRHSKSEPQLARVA